MFDSVMVPCPKCGEEVEFQSKSGDCFLNVYKLDEAPPDVLVDINRHSPHQCTNPACGVYFQVDLGKEETRPKVIQEVFYPHKKVVMLTPKEAEDATAEKMKRWNKVVADIQAAQGAPYRNPFE